MNIKFDINSEKLNFETNAKELASRLTTPFKKFINDFECESSVEVSVKREMWDRKLHGYTFKEFISLSESGNHLVSLYITRYHYFSLSDQCYSGADDYYKVELYYHDHCDCLIYSDDYYPEMSNDIVYDKICRLFKTGESFSKLDIKHRNKDK